MPDTETVRNGQYPVSFGCFAAYRASDEKGAPGRFVDWMFTPEGMKLIEMVGLVPVN